MHREFCVDRCMFGTDPPLYVEVMTQSCLIVRRQILWHGHVHML